MEGVAIRREKREQDAQTLAEDSVRKNPPHGVEGGEGMGNGPSEAGKQRRK